MNIAFSGQSNSSVFQKHCLQSILQFGLDVDHKKRIAIYKWMRHIGLMKVGTLEPTLLAVKLGFAVDVLWNAEADYARLLKEYVLYKEKNNWKVKAPTEKQLSYLRFLKYAGEPPQTKGEACQLINELVESKKQ